jgi:hypothetical protein
VAVVVWLVLLYVRALELTRARRLAFALWLVAIAGLAALVAWDIAETLPL